MPDLPSNAREVLLGLFLHGPLYDGDVPSKTGRDILHTDGLIERGWGYQWLNERGVARCLALKFDLERARRRRESYRAHTQALSTGFDDDEG